MVEVNQAKLVEFERNRSQLLGISAQKQQLQIQSMTMKQALDELAKTKEKKVYKAVGNILIQSDTAKVKKELEEKKSSADLRLKTIQKQEDSLINKLNKLKSEIESSQKPVTETQEPKKKVKE
ncbi:MAG: prefoldin subunit [Planctomycetes bacterium]|nr:prefoldin subunit [Planctomycetota bacterium]